MVTGCYFDHCI